MIRPLILTGLGFAFFLVGLGSSASNSRIITEDFSVANVSPQGTAVWNTARGKVHLPYIVDRDESNLTESEDDTIQIGTGEDGDFIISTYADWDLAKGADPSLVLLDTSKVYQFKSFSLQTGITVRGSGTSPLRIRVQGDLQIRGTIDIRGRDGTSITSALQTSAPGGASCCGGQSGGDGGSGNGMNGQSADAGALGGGRGGTLFNGSGNEGAGSGAGGGFGFAGAVGDNGVNSGGAGGAAGIAYGDVYNTELFGGSGGGAGGAKLGNQAAVGAGGGGGGGTIQISAGGTITIDSTGSILAQGGDGGGVSAGLLSGAGGGGAAGSIQLFAGGNHINNGIVYAKAGAAGVAPAGNGGIGSDGRTRWSNAITDSSSGSPIVEDPAPNMANFGQVYYLKSTSAFVESPVYDTRNSAPKFLEFSPTDSTPSGSSILYEIAGSGDGFKNDSTGYLALSQLSQLNGKRYFKWKATLNPGSDRTVSPEISKVAVTIEDHIQKDFSFGTGCASSSSKQRSESSPLYLGILLSTLGFAIGFAVILGRRFQA